MTLTPVPPRSVRWLPVAAGAALLLLAGLGTGGGALLRLRVSSVDGLPLPSGTEPDDRPTPTRLPDPTAAPRPRGPGGGPDLSGLLQVVGVLAAALLVAAVVALAVQTVRSRTRVPAPTSPAAGTLLPGGAPPPDRAELARAVAAAEEGLTGDEGPRERVLTCWLRLEQSVAATGVVRGPAETSSELTRRVLSEHAVQVSVLDELHGLYRSARYSAREVADDRPARAAVLLADVRRDLLGEP